MATEIATNIAPALKGFLDILKQLDQEMNIVYSEEYDDYISVINKLRSDNQGSSTTVFPLLSFRRDVIRYQDNGAGKRFHMVPTLNTSGDVQYRTLSGLIELDFSYWHKDMPHIENFELLYMTELGLSKGKEFYVTIPDLGEFTYYVQFSELDSKIINTVENSYRSVLGKASLYGQFVIATGPAKVIREIMLTIRNNLGEQLSSQLI